MGFYDRHVLPRLISLAMDQRQLEPYRRRLVREAQGRVREVGVGAGAQGLEVYQNAGTSVTGFSISVREVPTSVPEPWTAALLMIGAAATLLRTQRLR